MNHDVAGSDGEGFLEHPKTQEAAFQLWHEQLCGFVRRTAVGYGLAESYEGAEDIVQKVFEAAVRADWQDIRFPRAWLYAVARRMVIDAAARLVWKTIDQRPSSWVSMVRRPSTEVIVAAREITHLIAGLPDRQGQVAYLRHIEEWRFEEIAELLGISAATARVHDLRARAALRALASEPNYYSYDHESARYPLLSVRGCVVGSVAALAVVAVVAVGVLIIFGVL